MSKIYATDNLASQNWELQIENLTAPYAELFIGFTDKETVVKFKNLKFKYELRQGENIKSYGSYPPPGAKYIQSDQSYLVSEIIHLKADTPYTLFLWASNDKKEFQKSFEIIAKKPEAPFESWVWDKITQTWEAPIEYPEDNKIYIWNEEIQNWEEEKEDS